MTPTRLAHFRALIETRLAVATAIAARLGGRDRHDRALLGGLRDALARLASGTFGRCLACDGEIAESRLELRPHAERCLSCEQRRRRSGTPLARELRT